MKTIGLIGGMSWESTQLYYQLINQGIHARLGGLHSAEILLSSADFAPIADYQQQGDWQRLASDLKQRANRLANAGAHVLLICTNTMHKVADEVAEGLSCPLLHIVDATAKALRKDNRRTVGLLGTRFTMNEAFYKDRLEIQHGIDVITPTPEVQEDIHRIIYNELCKGVIRPASKAIYLQAIDALASQGADAVILGCTEIGLLVNRSDTAVPLYDTTAIHASAAVDYALGDN